MKWNLFTRTGDNSPTLTTDAVGSLTSTNDQCQQTVLWISAHRMDGAHIGASLCMQNTKVTVYSWVTNSQTTIQWPAVSQDTVGIFTIHNLNAGRTTGFMSLYESYTLLNVPPFTRTASEGQFLINDDPAKY